MLSHPLCPHDLPSRAQEKQKLAEAAAETLAAASRKPDVISGATARSAPADTAPAVCQVCGAQFLSKTKVCRLVSTLHLTVTLNCDNGIAPITSVTHAIEFYHAVSAIP